MSLKRTSVLFLLGSIVMPGCGSDPVIIIKDDDSITNFTLYSIDGRELPEAPQDVELRQSNPDKFLHYYPLLGKLDIGDKKIRSEIIAAFNRGVAEGSEPSKCFWPRHVIRIVRQGKFLDYVICFHCNQYVIYGEKGERLSEYETINSSPEKLLNDILKKAKIPIAPADF